MTRAPAIVIALAGIIGLALLPLLAPSYYASLMIPFFGYAIALLGFNLLFGYTGLLSFGHAMFLGFGAYGAAVLAGVLGIKSFEAVLFAVMLLAALAAVPIGVLCMRYVGIFFGMLTLAFGMLFYSFLFKFYHLTGGDSGMRVPRMNIIGLEFAHYNKIEFLAGPFYYYCLALLVIAACVMWRIVHSPFGLHLKALRDNPRKAEYLGVHVHQFRLAAFVISAAYGAAGGAILGFRIGIADPELVYWTQSGQLVFMAVLGGFSNFFGPIIGALAFTLLQDQLQSLTQYWRHSGVDCHRISRRAGRSRRRSALARAEVDMTALLETRAVSKDYGALRALSDVSIAIEAEELVSVVGPNGAGKTTLVNLLTGLLTPSAGDVLFMGESIAGIGPVRLAERGLVRSFQLIQIFPQLTVAETIAAAVVSRQGKRWRLFATLASDHAVRTRVAQVAEIFGLQHRLATSAAILSQGEKKLLDVASAFALDPRVILLDEPTSGVSTAEKHGIMQTLIAAAKRAGVQSILLVEHDMDLVAAYSHRIIALAEGCVLADLPPAQFFADPRLIESVIGKRMGQRC